PAKTSADNANMRHAIRPGAQSEAAASSWTDSIGDGTPHFLRLDSPEDRRAFRGWFVVIAEFQALRPPAEVPAEVSDCAALLRYSYRNALRAHDQAWLEETGVEPESSPPAIQKYRYPFTPLAAGRVRRE